MTNEKWIDVDSALEMIMKSTGCSRRKANKLLEKALNDGVRFKINSHPFNGAIQQVKRENHLS